MRTINKQTIVNASIETVYQSWTTKVGVDSFFGLDSKIELKKNGPYEIYFNMDAPYGLRGSEGCVFLDYQPHQFVSFSWNVPPLFKEARQQNYQSVVSVNLTKLEENKTTVVLHNTYTVNTSHLDDIVKYFEQAWEIVLNNLRRSFE